MLAGKQPHTTTPMLARVLPSSPTTSAPPGYTGAPFTNVDLKIRRGTLEVKRCRGFEWEQAGKGTRREQHQLPFAPVALS